MEVLSLLPWREKARMRGAVSKSTTRRSGPERLGAPEYQVHRESGRASAAKTSRLCDDPGIRAVTLD